TVVPRRLSELRARTPPGAPPARGGAPCATRRRRAICNFTEPDGMRIARAVPDRASRAGVPDRVRKCRYYNCEGKAVIVGQPDTAATSSPAPAVPGAAEGSRPRRPRCVCLPACLSALLRAPARFIEGSAMRSARVTRLLRRFAPRNDSRGVAAPAQWQPGLGAWLERQPGLNEAGHCEARASGPKQSRKAGRAWSKSAGRTLSESVGGALSKGAAWRAGAEGVMVTVTRALAVHRGLGDALCSRYEIASSRLRRSSQ